MASKFTAQPAAKRTNTSRVKPIPAAVDTQFVDTAAADDDNVVLRYLKAQQDMLDQAGVPSGRRFLCGMFASFVAGYAIGYVGITLIGLAVTATLALTGLSFLAFIVWLIGLFAMFVTAWVSGGHVFGYVVSKKIDEHYTQAKSFVSNLFTRRGLEDA